MFLTVTMSLLEGFSTTFKIFFLTLVFAAAAGTHYQLWLHEQNQAH